PDHGAGGTPAVRFADRRGEPPDGYGEPTLRDLDVAACIRSVPDAGGAATDVSGAIVRWSAADGRDRARPDVESAASALRRDFAGACAGDGRADLSLLCRHPW